MFDLLSYMIGKSRSGPSPEPSPSPVLYTLNVNNESNHSIKISYFQDGIRYTESISSGTSTFQLDQYGIYVIWAQSIEADECIYITGNQHPIISSNSIYALSPDEETGAIAIADEMPK